MVRSAPAYQVATSNEPSAANRTPASNISTWFFLNLNTVVALALAASEVSTCTSPSPSPGVTVKRPTIPRASGGIASEQGSTNTGVVRTPRPGNRRDSLDRYAGPPHGTS